MHAFALKTWGAALSLLLFVPPGEAGASPLVVHGRVTSHLTGAPIGGAWVSASVGETSLSTDSATDGSYSILLDVDPEAGNPGYVDATASGYVSAAVSFDSSLVDVGIDFSLRIAGTVSGTVHDAVTGQPLDQVTVEALQFDGTHWQSASSDVTSAGSYTLYGVEPGTYRICAGGVGTGFVRHCFDGVDIHAVADLQAATPVPVADGAAVSGIDLAVRQGAHVRGTIRNDVTGQPLAQQVLSMEIYDAAGNLLETPGAFTDDAGGYDLDGVPAGTFYFAAGIRYGALHGKRLYPGIPCPSDTCPPATTGQAIAVPLNGSVPGIDFAFRPIATLAGRVTDRTSGVPVAGARVNACALPIVVWPLCYGNDVDADGHYEIALDIGSYALIASGPDSHVDALYPDTPCWSFWCMTNHDNPSIHVFEGDALSGYDFALYRSTRISGTVTDATTGVPSQASVIMFDANYQFVWQFGVDENGRYTSPKWPAGTYYIAAHEGWQFRCTLYSGLPCPASESDPAGIAAIGPTPIIVADGETASGIDLQLPQAPIIFFDGFDPPFER